MPFMHQFRRLVLALTIVTISTMAAAHRSGQAATAPRDTVAATSTVWSWGDNAFGQLGRRADYADLVPAPVENLPADDPIAAIATRGYHDLALTQHGRVYAWGDNLYGQVGIASTDRSVAPTLIASLPTDDSVTAIATGNYHSLALTRAGIVYAWGWDSDGQLGDNGYSDVVRPVRVHGLPQNDRVVAIVAGFAHSLALTRAGRVYAWGRNDFGQLGDGSTENSAIPAQVRGLPSGDPIVAIAAGTSYSLALTRSGLVYAWGWNDTGQLGNGTTKNSSTPVAVIGLPGDDPIVSVAAGDAHNLALTQSGRVYAWGENVNGQLGPGSHSAYGVPVWVLGLPASDPISAVAASDSFSAAMTKAGRAYVWGLLPDLSRVAPQAVSGLPAVTAIAAGSDHMLALAVPPTPIYLRDAVSTGLAPLAEAWASGYTALHAAVSVSATVTDGAAAIDRWASGGLDIALSDGPLTGAQQQAAQSRCAAVASVPAAISVLSIIYNLPGMRGQVRLSPDLLAALFGGQVRFWNDVRVQRLNPTLHLPHLAVRVVHRADASGATTILTRYLTANSASWQRRVSAGPLVTWPTGTPVRGDLGMAAAVLRTPGSIGYVALSVAALHRLSTAALLNQAGRPITPGVAVAEAAASAAATLPEDQRLWPVDAPGITSYPLVGYAYLHLCVSSTGDVRTTALDLARYALTEGQNELAAQLYGPLPRAVQAEALATLDAVGQAPTATPMGTVPPTSSPVSAATTAAAAPSQTPGPVPTATPTAHS